MNRSYTAEQQSVRHSFSCYNKKTTTNLLVYILAKIYRKTRPTHNKKNKIEATTKQNYNARNNNVRYYI